MTNSDIKTRLQAVIDNCRGIVASTSVAESLEFILADIEREEIRKPAPTPAQVMKDYDVAIQKATKANQPEPATPVKEERFCGNCHPDGTDRCDTCTDLSHWRPEPAVMTKDCLSCLHHNFDGNNCSDTVSFCCNFDKWEPKDEPKLVSHLFLVIVKGIKCQLITQLRR